MRTKTVKLYKYDELSEEAKEQVLENFRRDNQYINDDWYDYLFDGFIEDAAKIGFDIEKSEITFSLGRDAHFGIRKNGISVNDGFIKKELGLKKEIWTDMKFNVNKIGYYKQEFPHDRWFDSSENAVGWYETIVECKNKDTVQKIQLFADDMLLNLVELCSKYYKKVYDEWNHIMSDEYIIEDIENNEYKFTENGGVT